MAAARQKDYLLCAKPMQVPSGPWLLLSSLAISSTWNNSRIDTHSWKRSMQSYWLYDLTRHRQVQLSELLHCSFVHWVECRVSEYFRLEEIAKKKGATMARRHYAWLCTKKLVLLSSCCHPYDVRPYSLVSSGVTHPLWAPTSLDT